MTLELPQEIHFKIDEYLFGTCENCFRSFYFWKLHRKVSFYEYVSIFHDLWNDYYVCSENPIKFNKICSVCFDLYKDDLHYIYI
jgi:hypothetical protein